jgi:protein tyrosine/serine phosphatase
MGHPAPEEGTRVLPLAGADNVRDLGGLPTADGRLTRRGRVFRGELLPSLVDEDVELLVRRVGLRTVVDLRSRGEVRHEAGGWFEHDVAWVNAPFRLGDFGPVPGPGADYVAGYLGFLRGGPRAVALAARTLMDPGSQPALFHCAAGKDRTGVLCALLLDVLGVTREAIAEDYAMTAAGLPGVFRRLVGVEPYRRTLAGADAADHEPLAPTIVAFLEAVDEQFGGTEAWLVEHGVEPALVDGFRSAMRERR